METKPSSCAGCGGPLPPRRYHGNPRKWCSESCRVKSYKVPGDKPIARPRPCRTCGVARVVGKGKLYCSPACYPVKTATCAQCDGEFEVRKAGTTYCSLSCSNRARAAAPEVAKALELERWQRKNRRRRAAMRGGISEPYSLAEIAARDRFRCGLCGKRVAMKQAVPHPSAPTIDHVVPISEGGDDTRANVQVAHFLCNSRKCNRGSQQLALIG